MSMFKVFDISGSAVSSQSQRLNVVASNLANVDTVAGPDGRAYQARQVVFQTVMMSASGNISASADPYGPGTDAVTASAGVRVSNITENDTPGRKVRDPSHPSADADGYVTYSNVNAVEEMVNMISASRSYQNNIEVMNTAKNLLMKTLQMGQS